MVDVQVADPQGTSTRTARPRAQGPRRVSILAPPSDATAADAVPDVPACFADLHLDEVVAAVTAGREDYDLAPFFHAPVRQLATIRYRHAVLHDLERPGVLQAIHRFADGMRTLRRRLSRAERLHHPRERQAHWLEAMAGYGDATRGLDLQLEGLPLESTGLRGLAEHVSSLVRSDVFRAMLDATGELRERLASERYRLRVMGTRVVVSRFVGEPDYSADVLATFDKFKQGAPREFPFDGRPTPEMDHVEAAIADLVARLHPDLFARLDAHCARYVDFVDPTLARFDREVQFYVAYLEQVERLRAAGLRFCYPQVDETPGEAAGRAVFDLALANRLVPQGTPVMTNDFELSAPERVLVVTGPNQGGKTTFARTVGQLYYLAGLGLPVPGTAARTSMVDRIYTHFEREEDLENQRSKLEDDLLRIHAVLRDATSGSLLVMNESLSSTTVADAVRLGREIMQRILDRGLLCVFVTFLDELASLGPGVVSMVSAVDPEDPVRRTFRLVRKPADGLAYAAAIAARYGLTYDGVRERIDR
jgi:DNA mismatch repair protein MutS